MRAWLSSRRSLRVSTISINNHLWLHHCAATMEEWERVFSTNVKGTLLCYKAAAKVMIEQNRGGRIIGKLWVALKNNALLRILGASSLAGKKSRRRHSISIIIFIHHSSGAPLCSTYGSTKFAIRCLTQTAGESFIRHE